jgi:hypothetical protein
MAVLSEQRLLRKETVRGNKLSRSDLREHLGNEGCLLPWKTQNRTTSSPCCRAWKTLEGWRTRLAATPLMTYVSPPPPTLSGRVSSGKCCGDFGLTVRHHTISTLPSGARNRVRGGERQRSAARARWAQVVRSGCIPKAN